MSQVTNIQKTSSLPSSPRKKYRAPQRPTIQELRHKYENQTSDSPKTPKPKSPKKMCKSKVKQIARMFNSKISQIIRRDNVDNKDIGLFNQPLSEPRATLPNPTRLTKAKAPAPCPCSKPKAKSEEKSACFVADEVFAKLTVKEKALLYTQFVEDMFRKNPKLGKSERLLETASKCDEIYCEVINEKKESVKSLWEELENRCKTSSNTSTPISLQRSGSVKKLEDMFYTWLKEREKHDVGKQDSSNSSEMDEDKQKSAIERLLEEAMAKLETMENSQEEETPTKESPKLVKVKEEPNALHNNANANNGNTKIQSHKKKPAPSIPQQQTKKPATSSESSSTTCSPASSDKQSETKGNESGVCSLTKTTSEESQPDVVGEPQSQSLKPLRKKKMRRSLSWGKDRYLAETYPIPTLESDPNCKEINANQSGKQTQHLDMDGPADESTLVEPSFIELDKSLMREVNSPRKIKSAYTLTVFSPARNKNEHGRQGLAEHEQEMDVSYVGKSKIADLQPEQPSLIQSFDQGFETGTNEIDCPNEQTQKLFLNCQGITTILPNCNKMDSNSPKVSFEPKLKLEKPSCFSTPIKEQKPPSFNSGRSGAQQQIFSPISTPYQNRRRSIYNNDSRRSSLAMQMIPEDKLLENHDMQSTVYNADNTYLFFANASTLEMSSNIIGLSAEKTSSFWIKSGDFAISLEIFHCGSERVKTLYEVFSQTSNETKNIYFGIDSHKFSTCKEDHFNISKRLLSNKECSHYWFSTGEMTIPFSGKILSPEKIQRLFQFIKASVEETGILRFGVDDVEFSNVPEFWTEASKFSLDSNYSLLVGLQSGNSNGLEGRSKYAWPHSKRVCSGDLDNSEYCDRINFESGRVSFPPFSSNYYNLASLGAKDLMTPRNSDAMKSAETFYQNFENEPLDQLFDNKSSFKQEKFVPTITEAPKMFDYMEQQKQNLCSAQQQLAGYNKYNGLSDDALQALKATPEYLAQLQNIVYDISQIGCKDDF